MRNLAKLTSIGALAAILNLATACGDGGTTDPPDGQTTGTIAVTANTTGDDQDADGYSVMLDGSEKAAIGVNGSVDLASVSPGTRSVSLSGVAENCAVGGDHPRSVTVTAGASTQVSFDVACSAAVGSIEVSVATTGDGTDPDGYSLLVDGVEVATPDVDGTVTVSGVAIGNRDVELGDLAPNCLVQGDNPQTVVVPFGASAVAAFDVRCFVSLPGVVAFGSRRSGRVEVFTWSGASGAVTQVTDSPEEGDDHGGYKFSPDGSKILYLADDGAFDLWVVNSNGSGQIRLTGGSEGGTGFNWSPDGQCVAFGRRIPTDSECEAFGAQCGIEIVNADGTGRSTLSDLKHAGDPVWAPDGSTILFLVWDFDTGERHIWRVNPDGSGQEQVTFSGFYSYVSYSPDGSRVLYTYAGEVGLPGSIGVMNADFSDPAALTEGSNPKWSPDESRIAFTNSEPPGTCEEQRRVQVMNSDGTGVTAVTPSGYCIQDFVWSPDGEWIAFWSYPQAEIYIVPSDGSGEPFNVSNHGADDWIGSWGP